MLEAIIILLAALVYGFAGRIVRPHSNRVGLILALIAGLLGLVAVTAPFDAPAAVWVYEVVWLVFLPAAVGIALPLVFPDGCLPGPRWRWVARVSVTTVRSSSLSASSETSSRCSRRTSASGSGVAERAGRFVVRQDE